ncbi:DciA family protein [Corynebacterium sp. SCR221107]|uniref:DciA family protein n=1 Tax=Corynebacterium sp. SCR221107 TaxID=3017361 RepID=UPI0022EC4D96|nr:DciA family protein [Corynebacterium sp. SCR221107]WBT08792.1 DciA family protein [Corynebacterium sp. SCR221107]
MSERQGTPAGDSPQAPVDPIAAAFRQIRQEAIKRNGTAPDLSHQLPRRRQTSESKNAIRRKGMPTGRDGRRLPRRDTMEGIGSVLNTEIHKRGWRKEIAGGWIMTHWPELVGERIAQHTKVEMVKDKAVFITCDTTAWATNLRMMQRNILQSIAAQLGPDIVAELKIYGPKTPSWRHGPLHVKGRGPRDTYG